MRACAPGLRSNELINYLPALKGFQLSINLATVHWFKRERERVKHVFERFAESSAESISFPESALPGLVPWICVQAIPINK